MGAVELARAVADPEEMGRAVVPVAGRWNRRGSAPARRAAAAPRGWCRNRSRRIAAWSLVMPQAAMKASVSSMRSARSSYRAAGGERRRNRGSSDAPRAGRHNRRRRRRAAGSACGGLEIGVHHARRIGHARFWREFRPVDDVAAVAGQRRRRRSPRCREERGLANWPAMRPIFTTGTPAPKVSTTAICSRTRNVSRMMLAVKSAKLSAQSPPCSTKALPSATGPAPPSAAAPRRRRPAADSGAGAHIAPSAASPHSPASAGRKRITMTLRTRLTPPRPLP